MLENVIRSVSMVVMSERERMKGSVGYGSLNLGVRNELEESILPLPESIQSCTESKGLVLTLHESILALLESIPLC
ncbi:hypothetical protein PIB30_082461 [Stylosanthes scabra]|uniref:Uncharacterized protein n=1 Tax=Stylosanthes scabra TaxID=79078 RepID=A0ABU6YPL2_9FABA|nr:hypothetical protein [Stylosanthes scabra]